MPKKVMRYLIPADEQDIVLPLTGKVLFVNHTADGIIECYAEEVEGATTIYTALRVMDTGRSVPDYFSYLGSVVIGKNARHVYVSVPADEAPSWGSTPDPMLAEEYSAWEKEKPWTPASTNDADAENARNSDLPAWPKYDEIDPGASR